MMLKSAKYSLEKKEEPKNINEVMIDFAVKHPKIVFMTLFVILAALFALLFGWMYFMSATEHYYNFYGV